MALILLISAAAASLFGAALAFAAFSFATADHHCNGHRYPRTVSEAHQ
jgi:hypothetical protein